MQYKIIGSQDGQVASGVIIRNASDAFVEGNEWAQLKECGKEIEQSRKSGRRSNVRERETLGSMNVEETSRYLRGA